MDNMFVAVFENERQASAAAGAMKDLCREGVLLAYAFAVIVKDIGKVSVVEFDRQERKDTVLGAATRGLIKLLEEPYSSFDKGNSEAITDAMMELGRVGVDAVFLDEVTRHFLPGRAAIVSEIEEEKINAIDTLLESQGGIVFRCARREIMDTQIAEELNALHNEIQFLEKRLLQTLDGSQAELQAKLDIARAKFRATKDRARYHSASIKREAEAKIAALQTRAAKGKGGIKAKLERLADEVRVDYVNRATKLNLAWRLAGDVFVGVSSCPYSSDSLGRTTCHSRNGSDV